MFVKISEFKANTVDPDQTRRSAVTYLGLHSLPMSLLWDARHKLVKKGTLLSLINTASCNERAKQRYQP